MPKQVDPVAQRRAIASAAIAVIAEAGLEGTRLRDVARAAHVTTGAVTHYFDGKDEVLEAALQEIVRRILARQGKPQVRVEPGAVAPFLRRACTYLPLEEAGRQEWRVWLAFWGRAVADPRLRAVHRHHYAEIVGRLVGSLQALRGDAPAPAREATRCADALLAAIDGVGTRATLEPELWPASRQREVLTALLSPLLASFLVECGAGVRARRGRG
jgi:TetR/AcrR family transcriptional regulator, transcriptional repressor of bet genes